MSSEEKNTVFNTLLEVGCCKRCAFRFTGDIDANYDDPVNVEVGNNHNGNFEQDVKKLKSNPCCVCLDILRDSLLEDTVNSKEIEKCSQYDSGTFINYISYPTAVLVREHSMDIFIKEKYPKYFEDHRVVALNKAWSLSIQNKLSQKLSKKYNKNSGFQIQVVFEYELEKEEASAVCPLIDNNKKTGNKNEILSRNVLIENLKTIDNEIFRKFIPVPPNTPTKAVTFSSFTYLHEPIFIAGRYCKYSRNLGQTPWFIDSVRVVENSVQEIIFEALDNVFNCRELVFSSSGREDFDVRTLGRGRPFFIKICDPKITTVQFEKFRLIEKEIKNTHLIEVRDLQLVDRKLLSNIKDGEQFKKKTYKALCIVTEPENMENYIDKINSLSNVVLDQKTPIRVFHRRSSDIRKREIYTLYAKSIPGRDNLFELDLVTQAGTYVKEFVHGDIGRTKPSLGQIIGGKVDIVTLDVLDIDLDFPPSITNKKNS